MTDAPPHASLGGVPHEPGARKPNPVLVADGVVRTFGGLRAVDVDHFEVEAGTITGLIGPNGAGKTTLFNLLTGFDRVDSGRWTFQGTDISRLPAHKVARAGMVRTFQLTKALSKLTVIDNMLLGAGAQTGERFLSALLPFRWRAEERVSTARAEDLLGRFNLAHMRDEFAGTLSGGQRKLLEMARALMASPQLLMLDEPMAGVNPALTQSLLGHIKDLRDEGLTIIFVEHDMDVVRDISDWVVVMAEGNIVAEGPHASVVADERVIEAYLGAHHGAPLERVDVAELAQEIAAELAEEDAG